ncbi:MAG: hypothetical protein RLZZ587_237 [Actinomycetota bacterium]|jgi:hypothetical protein
MKSIDVRDAGRQLSNVKKLAQCEPILLTQDGEQSLVMMNATLARNALTALSESLKESKG